MLCGFTFLLNQVQAQVERSDQFRQEEEVFKKKMEEKQKNISANSDSIFLRIHMEFDAFERERERDILAWEGKNIDPILLKKASEIELQVKLGAYLIEHPEEDVDLRGAEIKLLDSERPKSVGLALKEVANRSKEGGEAARSTSGKSRASHQESVKFSRLQFDPINERQVKDEIAANRPIVFPLTEGSYQISSRYNRSRMHPILKKVRPHYGLDFAAKKGTPVYASAAGKVEIAKYSNSAGNFVMINHQNGYKTQYLHLDKYVVKNGALVEFGDLIGYVGSSGYSTGPHLHFEIRRKNQPVDPERILMAHTRRD